MVERGAMDQTPAANPVITATDLRKEFGGKVAVDGISFEVGRGEIFGVLGPNGAGKTTTMRMLSAISRPTAGRLRVLGMDPVKDGAAVRSRLGIVPQADLLDDELTVMENLVVYAGFFGIHHQAAKARSLELLRYVELADRRGERAENLSGGMRRRLSIARGLVNDPDVLLLDEPTASLDPQAKHLLWERISSLKDQGTTVVLTTHHMDEAEHLCDRLIVMLAGRIIAAGPPRDLIGRYARREVIEIRPGSGHTAGELAAVVLGLGADVDALADRLLLHVDNGDDLLPAVQALLGSGEAVYVRRANLEDVFLRLTGRRLVDE